MYRRKVLSLMTSAGLGFGFLPSIVSDPHFGDWESETWDAGTHYWRWHRNGELFFQYKDYGAYDLVSVQKFTADGELDRQIVPQREVDSRKEALQIISAYQ
jgi:hypothetical protein